ncbi:MAG: tRNA (guanosine(37)-N1)-methyltransferase TrmD [Clostridia bacterium]|nr:tRNA (guanosine(37)-N1)-methyltransferase TrmD [Clostridia bacterium]
MKIDILTLFPEMFETLNHSILERAQKNNLLQINIQNIRDFSKDKHKKVDDTPFGGGAGMVMTCQPLFDAINSVKTDGAKIVYMSPKGKLLKQNVVVELAKCEHIIIVCGHYEGIDQRVIDHFDMEEISIGDYVLTGGELPAMVLVDAVSRYVDGVLSEGSTDEESFSNGLLEYPQYTKPREYEGLVVPEVLTNGNHKEIEKWKKEQSLKITKERRPDLYKKYNDEN